MKYLKTALLLAGSLAASVFNTATALTKGHDISSVGIMETQEGAHWLNAKGTNTSLEKILGAGGMEAVRLRLWTAGDYDLDYTLGLAKRFYKQGYKIYLDFHFSDTWADGTHQAIPAAWDNTSIDTLAADLRAYVKSTLKSFTAAGVPLDIVSIGNEITYGMLFPRGQIITNSVTNFSGLAKLWKAARQGVTDAVAAGTTKPKVMIHLDNGWNYTRMSWFFKGLFATGTVSTSDVDVFGFSYYPFYGTGATLKALTSSLTQLANTYKKPLYVVETDWPTECTGVTLSENYPINAKGQRQWVAAIIAVLEGLPNNLGAGIFYWEPAYIKVAGLGSSCESALLFSVDWSKWPTTYATALSSVYMYA